MTATNDAGVPDKRQLIMQTAERLFTHRRIHEITLDEVAQKAHVGKGTIYRYFEDKDDLFFQVATSGFDELCEVLQAQVAAEGPFRPRLLQMAVALTTFFEGRREMFRMMQAEDARMPECKALLRERWLKHRRRLVESVAGVLRQGVGEGFVREDVSLEVLANLLLGMLRARTMDLRDIPENERRHDLVIDIFLNGARGRENGEEVDAQA